MARSKMEIDRAALKSSHDTLHKSAQTAKAKTRKTLKGAKRLGSTAGHKVFAAWIDGVLDELAQHLPDDIERLVSSYADGLLDLDSAMRVADQKLAKQAGRSGAVAVFSGPADLGGGPVTIQGSAPNLQGSPMTLSGAAPSSATQSPGSEATSPTSVTAADFRGEGEAFGADWRHTSTGKDGTAYDQWGFGYGDPANAASGGDCTSFVAWRLNQLAQARGLDWRFSNDAITGVSLTQGSLGDAQNWGLAVPQDLQSSSPAVGDVAWFGHPNDHVAIVRAVNSDGSIVIEESNWGGKLYDQRTLPRSGYWPTAFLRLLPGS